MNCFVACAWTKQFSRATKPFWAFGAELRKRLMVINPPTKTAPSATGTNRRQSNADHQLHPRLCLRVGWFVDGRLRRDRSAWRWYVLLQRLADCRVPRSRRRGALNARLMQSREGCP